MRNGKRGANRQIKATVRDRQLIPHPPQLPSYGLTRDVRLRFLSTSAFNGAVTYQNLLDTVLVASTTIAGFDLFDSVRVNAVELWAIAPVGTAATVILVYDGLVVGATGDRKTHTDTSMGIEPAHVRARPDPLTQTGQFQPSSSIPAFLLDIPTDTVIDVSLTMRQPILGNAMPAQNALVGASPGVVYYRGLDGRASSTTVLPVQGAVSVE
jgi:hypothetical protein